MPRIIKPVMHGRDWDDDHEWRRHSRRWDDDHEWRRHSRRHRDDDW